MIKELKSDLASFKTLTFKSGLNILLAERHETSGSKDTRNGTGKTSFIELLHFLVTDKRYKDDDFHKAELVGATFSATFLDNGSDFKISRKSGLSADEWRLNGETIQASELKVNLAQRWFGLAKEDTDQKYSPLFSALLSYFARKERIGGFAAPVMNSSKQQNWDSQVCLSYLLGFDWSLPQKLQIKKDEKKAIDSLAQMIKSGYFTNGSFDINKMQARLDLLDREVKLKREEVSSSTVVDGYRQHEIMANHLTSSIRNLNEANLKDLDLLENIDLALAEVQDTNLADVQSLYNQVGVFFSEQVKKRFEQVTAFHKQVSQNRETHLKRERKSASERLESRKKEIIKLQQKLTDKMYLLRSGMALERLTHLQSDLNKLEAEQADLVQQIPKFRNVKDDQKRLKREVDDFLDLIADDVLAREEPRKLATNTFAETSKFLYDEPGQLIIGRSKAEAGLSIETDIVGKKSGGKNHMQVFCFDWTLVETANRQNKFPGFLVHDSHIFDGVDGRQIGLALQLAQKKCEELGVQYIIAMNSDDFDKLELVSEGENVFDPYDYVMETRLTDKPNGGLFGVRF